MSNSPRHIQFTFMTATSGNYQTLLERVGVIESKDLVNLALHYFEIYMRGACGEDLPLVMYNPHTLKVYEIDDKESPVHHAAEELQFTVNNDHFEETANRLKIANASEMMTRAFIILERICDLEEAGWLVGCYDKKEKVIDAIENPLYISRPTLTPTPVGHKPVFN